MKREAIEVSLRKSSKQVRISLARVGDIPGILGLQAKYHRSEIGTDPRRGFLTCTFNEQQMREMVLDDIGVIVAINEEGSVVGYNILMSSSLASKYPQYSQLMTFYLQTKGFKNAVLSRQYCIDEPYRGGVLVKRIYEFQRELLKALRLNMSFGEVDSQNEISMKCVQCILGYSAVGMYVGEGDRITWHVFDREEY